jgi:hypothetical protein
MNAFEDDAFREAVEATRRKRLIISGLHTEICLTFATVGVAEAETQAAAAALGAG